MGSSIFFCCLLFLSYIICINAQCGMSKDTEEIDRSRAKRVISGMPALDGKYPWQILLQCSRDGKRFFCGGTVIGDKWILTAAHCLQDVDKGTCRVIVGESDTTTVKAENLYMTELYLTHENFDETSRSNDIALLRLHRTISYTENIQPICLPSRDQDISSDSTATVVGFGFYSFPEEKEIVKSRSDVLLEAQVPILNECEIHWNATVESQICAGGKRLGFGSGDSGGPLLVRSIDRRWYEIGIVSYGTVNVENVNDVNKSGIYTKVSHYCDWIEEKTNNEVQCDKERTEFV